MGKTYGLFLYEIQFALGHSGKVAFLANAFHDERVAFRLKPLFLRNLANGFLDGRGLELDHFAATGALQVVMLRVAVIVFVKGAGAQFQPSQQTGIHQFCQSPVSGRPANLQAGGLHFLEDLFGIKVIVVAENKANHVPLLAGKPLGLGPGSQIFPKFFLGRLRYRYGLQFHGKILFQGGL